MKIGLLGISELGNKYLEYFVKNGHDIVFVTSKYKSFKHADEHQTEMENFCKKNNIRNLGSVDVNKEPVLSLARETDVCIIGGYDKILKEEFLMAPRLGTLNTHFGLIPEQRGCNPTMWAFLYGVDYGYTTYVVTPDIDLGEIIIKRKFKILSKDNAKSIYDKLTQRAVDDLPLLMENLEKWKWKKVPITKLNSCYHKKGLPNDGIISWNWNPFFLLSFSKSLTFPPYKGPITIKKTGEEIEIFVKFAKKSTSNEKIGTIISKKGNTIYVQGKNCIFECESRNSNLKGGEKLISILGKNHPIPLEYDKPFLNKKFCDL